MKKHITTLLAIGFIGQVAHAQGTASSGFNLDYKIADDRRSVAVQVQNTLAQDLVCSDVVVQVTLMGTQYNDQVGGAHISLGPVYLNAGQDQLVQGVGANKTGENMAIASAEVQAVGCRPADFQAYCQLANKTPEEEQTIAAILKETETASCQHAEREMDTTLRLKGKGITSVRPLGFLARLRKLDLSTNRIVDLQPLNTLHRLQVLDISNNPVVDLAPVVTLPNIEKIRAVGTQVDPKLLPKPSPSLKKIVL